MNAIFLAFLLFSQTVIAGIESDPRTFEPVYERLVEVDDQCNRLCQTPDYIRNASSIEFKESGEPDSPIIIFKSGNETLHEQALSRISSKSANTLIYVYEWGPSVYYTRGFGAEPPTNIIAHRIQVDLLGKDKPTIDVSYFRRWTTPRGYWDQTWYSKRFQTNAE